MKYQIQLFITAFLLLSTSAWADGHQWTLQECLDYALQNNIQLKQKSIATASSREDVAQSKSALLPSLSFSTNQNTSYRPFSEQTTTLESGTMTTSTNAVSYNGSYGLNANWTIWNGGRNRLNIQQNQLAEQQNEYAEQEQANTIQEQITRLFIQVLYEKEAIAVSEAVLKASKMQLERAKTMVETGTLAHVDQVQLESQVAQDELSLVSVKSQYDNYQLQLKQLLEIHDDEPFDIIDPEISGERVLLPIPQKAEVFASALQNRPEIKSQQLNIESSELSLRSARAGFLPTVSLSGAVGTSNFSAGTSNFASQIKNNLSTSVGVSLSIPIFDNHTTRTNVRKAKYAQETAQLQMQDAEKQLYSSIENYYLEASTNQQKYIYAQKNADSMQESYDLVSEQFRLGLKNIVELTTGKNNLLQAQQQLLETKYTALFNQAMLRFYQGQTINL